MARLASPALRALLAGAVDYAGCFAPASLSLPQAVENYRSYRNGPFHWMLGRFVIRREDVEAAPPDLDGCLAVTGAEDHARASAMETPAVAHFQKPTYCEVTAAGLPDVREAHSFAKLRTGSVDTAAIPSSAAVAQFMLECARLKLAFKATAGLHHPLRSVQPVSYEHGAPKAWMHGFVNVLFAACLCWRGCDVALIIDVLEETQAEAFRFDEHAHWRGHSLSAAEIQCARRDFLHSFGSCSFSEPVSELEQLRWL